MDNKTRHLFLRNDKAVHNLSSNALERIISRGLGQEVRKEIGIKPILPLVNAEGHIIASDVDVTSRHVAFGRWAIPKLKKELGSSDPLISKRAILSLLDMVHDPEKAVEAIRLRVIPRLVRLMISEDAFVRQHSTMILQVLAIQPHGKMAIVQHKSIMKNLSELLNDENNLVRLAAAQTAHSLAAWYFGVNEMIKQNFIVILIQRLNIELEDNITVALLETLEFLLDQDMASKQQALENNGIELAVLLEHPLAEIRSRAAAVIAQMLKHPTGKQAVLDHKADILAILTTLLEDSDIEVKTHATAALMFVMCKTEAKLRSLKLKTPLYLIRCAQFFNQPALQLNAIKALTSLAESPDGQNLFKTNFHLVEYIRPADPQVMRHKNILITVINRVI